MLLSGGLSKAQVSATINMLEMQIGKETHTPLPGQLALRFQMAKTWKGLNPMAAGRLAKGSTSMTDGNENRGQPSCNRVRCQRSQT
tara:strand:+ start:125 stop:382 length:258 start_codon:yes stop_codon:yes gene_type:complete